MRTSIPRTIVLGKGHTGHDRLKSVDPETHEYLKSAREAMPIVVDEDHVLIGMTSNIMRPLAHGWVSKPWQKFQGRWGR